MTLFLTFCISVVLMVGALRLIRHEPEEGCFSNEGAAFVGATVVAALAGLLGSGITHVGALPFAHLLLTGRHAASSPYDMTRPLALRHSIIGGIGLLVVALGLFASTCWAERDSKKLWAGNLLLLAAAVLATIVYPDSIMNVLRRPASDSYVGFGLLAVPVTAVWIWAIARVTSALNRVPQVTGGYFGMLALALLWMLKTDNRTALYFPTVACAAIAGAGLASLPRSLRRPGFNLGRPAALTLGYLVALIAAVGLLKDTVLAIVALSSLVFGLPLLDVSFFKVRAALRGERLDPEYAHTRLHEALLRHGISPAKVSLLYLAIGAFLCGLGVYAARILLIERGIVNLLLQLGFVGCCIVCAFIVFFSLTRILMRRDATQALPEEVEAFGVRISVVSMMEALDKIEGYIAARQPRHVVTSDANAILRAQEDPEYASILRRAALITPDGFGVIWGARLLNLPLYERVTGVDMVTGICERAARSGHSIYILGAAPGVAATAAEKLAERFPGLRVAGTEHGYFEAADETAVVQRIADAHPDVLFVAFGIPKQEKFIARHLEAMRVPVCLGVGGSFDVYSERLKRAPEYIQRSGLEWLYRVWQEPTRWKRLGYVPRFMVLALKEWLFRSRHKTDRKPTNAAS